MPAQAPPRYRRRVVRAGLGIGTGLTVFALAAAAQADALPALPGTLIYLEGQWASALLFAVLLGLGVALQALGLYLASPRGLRCALLGAALVVGAGLFDRDPVLVVGQVVLVAALWPVAAKKFQKSGLVRHRGARNYNNGVPQGRSFQTGRGGGE